MLLQPFSAAHRSAAANNFAPVPVLRCFSSTTSPFTSARKATSSCGGTLTCSHPVTVFSDSATKIAYCVLAPIRFILWRISFRLAGYPSCPLSSAIREASWSLARRIFILFGPREFIELAILLPQSPLYGVAPQFPQRVCRNPSSHAGVSLAQFFSDSNRFPIELLVSLSNIAERPVYRFLYAV